MELPRWQCHKIVRAEKIESIEIGDADIGQTPGATITLVGLEQPFYVGPSYMRKHDAQPGGYYVVYEDGYDSFSPAKAFEEGYTRIE